MSQGQEPINPIGAEGAISIGLTKREYFAAQAMVGLIANSYSNGVSQPLSEANNSEIAKMAVYQADALIAELNK